MGNTQHGRAGPFSGGPFRPPHPQDVYRPAGPYPAPDRGQIETFPYQNPTQPFAPGYMSNRQNVATQYPQQNIVPPQGYQPGYPGNQPQAFQHQTYPPQTQPGFQPPGYAPPGYPQGHPPQGYPPQGYPPQGYPPQGYPPQGHPQTPPSTLAQTTLCAACTACLTCLFCSCCQGLLGVPTDDSIAEGTETSSAQPQVSPPGPAPDDD